VLNLTLKVLPLKLRRWRLKLKSPQEIENQKEKCDWQGSNKRLGQVEIGGERKEQR